MPIYEYQCEACGYKLEKLQKMSDDPLKICPECSAPKLTKLVSAVAFRLKGSGWYETDFKNNNKKNVSEGDSKPSESSSPSESDSSGGSSKSTDSDSSSSSSTSDSEGKSSSDSSKSAAAS